MRLRTTETKTEGLMLVLTLPTVNGRLHMKKCKPYSTGIAERGR